MGGGRRTPFPRCDELKIQNLVLPHRGLLLWVIYRKNTYLTDMVVLKLLSFVQQFIFSNLTLLEYYEKAVDHDI